MKKRILTIFLIMILAVTNLNVCYASGVAGLVGIGLGNYNETIDKTFSEHNEEGIAVQEWKDAASEGFSGILKLVMNILSFIPKLIVNVLLEVILLIIPCMDDIVFNDKVSLWGNFFRLTYFDTYQRGLAGQMVSFVSTIYQIFRYIALIGFVVAIAVLAVKMIMSSIGKKKQQYKESLKGWLTGLVLLIVGHWIMIYAIYFSELLVDVVVKVKDSFVDGWLVAMQGGNATFDLVSAFSTAVGSAGTAAWGMTLLIIWACCAIVAIVIFIGMNLKIVKVYLERVIIVGVLIMIFPLVTVLYAFEKGGIKKGSTFESWLRTFIDQVFIQPIHALTLLGVCIALIAISNVGITAIPIIGMILVLMVLNTMFTIENVIKRVFAINGASLGSPVNPVGAVMAGVGMAAPMVRNMDKVSKAAVQEAKAIKPNATKRELQKVGRKAFREAGGQNFIEGFSPSTKYGRKNFSDVFGKLGVSLPQELFDVDKLSYTEQQTAKKRIGRASVNLSSEAGIELNSAVKNMRNMIDPDTEAAIRRKCGVSLSDINNSTLNGTTGNSNKDLAMRRYLQMLSDPTVDVSKLDDTELGYYQSHDKSAIARDLEKGKKLSSGGTITPETKMARKIYMLQNSDKADAFMKDIKLGKDANGKEINLDETVLDRVENGGGTDNEKLAYELFLRKCEGVNVDAVDCRDTNYNYDAQTVENIEMSEKSIEKKLAGGRDVTAGNAVGSGVITARKVYAAIQRKKYEKYVSDSGLDEARISGIEDGTNTDANDILAYQVMVDRMRTGNDLDTYKVNGSLSPEVYAGVSASDSDLGNMAVDLVSQAPDVVADVGANKKARSVLAGLKNKDEQKLRRCAASIPYPVDFNELENFINSGTTSLTPESILVVIEETIKAQ